jgi:opacity protein-like surface antigen
MAFAHTVIPRAALAACAVFVAAVAQAQQPEAHSPYSLGFSTGRAPIGLNVSMVGRAQFSAFSAFGKVGATTATRSDTSIMGMAPPLNDPGNGMSWGAGVSWDFTSRLSATFEWISNDLRMPTGPVRTTSLGLQFKY